MPEASAAGKIKDRTVSAGLDLYHAGAQRLGEIHQPAPLRGVAGAGHAVRHHPHAFGTQIGFEPLQCFRRDGPVVGGAFKVTAQPLAGIGLDGVKAEAFRGGDRLGERAVAKRVGLDGQLD
jgi:hypothetical protein